MGKHTLTSTMKLGWQWTLAYDWVTISALICGSAALLVLIVGMALPEAQKHVVVRVIPAKINVLWTFLHDMDIAMSRGCSLVSRISETRWTEEMGKKTSVVSWIESHAVKPLGFVRHGATSDVPLTMMLEFDLVPCAQGVEVHVRELTTIRDGNWKVPFLRVLVWCWPGFHANDYLYRVEEALKSRIESPTGSDGHQKVS